MTKKHIIIDPDYGVFLGTQPDPEGEGVGMLFSSHNFLELTTAVSWKTKEAAKAYMSRYIKKHCPDCFIAVIDSVNYKKDNYVTVTDICKSGYGDYATEMVDAIQMNNTTVH